VKGYDDEVRGYKDHLSFQYLSSYESSNWFKIKDYSSEYHPPAKNPEDQSIFMTPKPKYRKKKGNIFFSDKLKRQTAFGLLKIWSMTINITPLISISPFSISLWHFLSSKEPPELYCLSSFLIEYFCELSRSLCSSACLLNIFDESWLQDKLAMVYSFFQGFCSYIFYHFPLLWFFGRLLRTSDFAIFSG